MVQLGETTVLEESVGEEVSGRGLEELIGQVTLRGNGSGVGGVDVRSVSWGHSYVVLAVEKVGGLLIWVDSADGVVGVDRGLSCVRVDVKEVPRLLNVGLAGVRISVSRVRSMLKGMSAEFVLTGGGPVAGGAGWEDGFAAGVRETGSSNVFLINSRDDAGGG